MKTWIRPVVLIVALSTSVVLASYLVTTQVFTVDVEEAIVVGEQTTTTLVLYPGDTKSVEVVITNLSDNPLPVEIEGSVVPPEDIMVTDPGSVTIPADGEPHSFFVSVTADTDIAVGEYDLTVEVKRE